MKKVFLSHSRSSLGFSHVLSILAAELSLRGIEVLRADELAAGANWQASIVSAIKKADALIAVVDFAKSNSNVMLEIGYAIGAGRQVILLCENPAEIPFDLSSMPALAINHFGPWTVDEIVHRIEAIASKSQFDRPILKSARDRLHQATIDPEYLDQISPADFEGLIGDFFSDLGISVELLRGNNETGFDIILHIGRRSTAVLVKKYASQGRLGIGDVQRLVGACVVAGMRTGLMITNTGYTTSAQRFALHSPVAIHLLTLQDLVSESAESLIGRCTGG